jgi:hypothetical protein
VFVRRFEHERPWSGHRWWLDACERADVLDIKLAKRFENWPESGIGPDMPSIIAAVLMFWTLVALLVTNLLQQTHWPAPTATAPGSPMVAGQIAKALSNRSPCHSALFVGAIGGVLKRPFGLRQILLSEF